MHLRDRKSPPTLISPHFRIIVCSATTAEMERRWSVVAREKLTPVDSLQKQERRSPQVVQGVQPPAIGAPYRIVDLAVGTMRVTTIAERSR